MSTLLILLIPFLIIGIALLAVIKKGFNEVITGLAVIKDRLDRMEQKSDDKG